MELPNLPDPLAHHKQRSSTPEAALGVPNPDFCDVFGALQVPYLSPSWREISIVGHLQHLELVDQAQAIYTLIARRLPELTFDEFADLTGPDHFLDWWTATRAPSSGGGDGPPSTGRVPSRPSPWRVLLATG
ncbi:hypothetical protein [Deinococcus sp. QL22]|uniref:hypothetical protein n=1 Tax=Deinococcus sp. QL22 TaxID=2939437 RepID=UPI002016ECBA|nr:hypothetical protein [Deinococcus sp. QL22]UQN06762.1 hypothetical protein M1R55_02235 [Deinococcus sp. QL22]